MEQRAVYHDGPETSTERGAFTPIPDVILDELLPELSGAELKVFMYLARRTYGFQKQADSVSVSQMAEGIKRRDGTILDRGTGLSRRAVISAVGSLRDRGLLWKVRNYDERRGDMANTYTLTLPQPCPRYEVGGGCKNDTPRVQKVHPQKTAGQKREEIYSVGDGQSPPTEEKVSTDRKNPTASSPKTTTSGEQTNSAQKGSEKTGADRYVGMIVSGLKAQRILFDEDDLGKLGKNFRRLIDAGAAEDDELVRAAYFLVAHWGEGYRSPKTAIEVLRGERGSRSREESREAGKTPAQPSPPEVIEALKTYENNGDTSLRRLAPLAEKWDFTREDDPDWKILNEISRDHMERSQLLKRVRSVAKRAIREAGSSFGGDAEERPAISPEERERVIAILEDSNTKPGQLARAYIEDRENAPHTPLPVALAVGAELANDENKGRGEYLELVWTHLLDQHKAAKEAVA